MKLLLLAALRTKKHFYLAIIALVTLIFLSVANQMEIFSIGVLSNSGADFFTLFGTKKEAVSKISFKDVENKWKKIDRKHRGVISKRDASSYLASQKGKNPLQWIFYKVTDYFDFHKNFVSLIIFLVGVALFKAVFLFTARYATQKLSVLVTRDLRQQYFEHLQTLSLGFYQTQNIGSLTSRSVADAGQIASSLNSFLTNFVQTPFAIVSNLFLCFFLSWRLSLVIFFGLPLVIIPVIYLTKRVKKYSRQLQRNQENFSSVLIDFLSGIQVVKMFSMESFSLEKYKEQNDLQAHLECKSAKFSLLTRPILHTITTFCLAVVVIFGLYFLQMTISQLLVFCGLLHLFYEPVKKFAEESANVQRGIVAAERMFEVLNLKPEIQDQEGALEFEDFTDKIEFDHVSFKYQDVWVLKDLSFTVEKGQTVAIVGPTGAGKSTIVQLIPRLYDVQEGEIRIDGVSLKKYSQKSLREKISFVPQKSFLFFDTILQNVGFGRKFALEDIILASKKAYAHEFIIKMPDHYHTKLAEAGKNLSGGQQQRIAIARALMKKAPILVMDEATSSLDAISENRIKKAMEDLHGEVTQIIIAHRLSTIEHVDKIIFLDQGRKVAEGTKDELLCSCESFRNMWNAFHHTKETEPVNS